jgi:integrase
MEFSSALPKARRVSVRQGAGDGRKHHPCEQAFPVVSLDRSVALVAGKTGALGSRIAPLDARAAAEAAGHAPGIYPIERVFAFEDARSTVVRLADLDRIELQRFVYRLLEKGLSPSTIDVTLLPLRAVYRHALDRGEVAVNPCDKLRMPRSDSRRERIADPAEAEALIAALPIEDRAVWATAMYAGLRRGELMALRWEDVDLAAGIIRVERGWELVEREPIALKTNAGRRKVPIAAVLRDYLIEHRQRTQRDGFVFGEERPFSPRRLSERADDAWTEAKLTRITLHECRHSFASLMIAAGVNAKALSTYMGHANISITLDRYGHLMPGNEDEAAGLLDAYLEAQAKQAADKARAAGSGAPTGVRVGADAAKPLAQAK